MIPLTDLMDRLGAATTRAVLGAYDAWLAGHLDDAELVDAIAALIAAGSERGQVLAVADLVARFYLDTADTGAVIAAGAIPTALPHHGDLDRLATAARTVLDGPDVDVEMRLDRLARAEVYEATQAQYSAAMTATPEVAGWRRGMEPGACELCGWWSRGDRVWAPDHRMPTHKGCRCHPIPVFTTASTRRPAV